MVSELLLELVVGHQLHLRRVKIRSRLHLLIPIEIVLDSSLIEGIVVLPAQRTAVVLAEVSPLLLLSNFRLILNTSKLILVLASE